jgi:YgiT-type zinc finger domain-containing protein
MLKKCALCNGKVVNKFVTAENWWADSLTLIENVPAFVCESCGEQYFDAKTSIILDQIRSTDRLKAKRFITVPVYEFDEPGVANDNTR